MESEKELANDDNDDVDGDGELLNTKVTLINNNNKHSSQDIF